MLAQSVSQSLDSSIDRCYSTVVSFSPHPVEFFSGKRLPTLTPGDEKVQQIAQFGVEQLVLLPFDRALASLTPQEFVEEILVRRLKARFISIGEDFRFGCKRSGTAEDLRTIAATYGIEVTLICLETFQGERISSTAIRNALQSGNLQTATRMLGRSYSLVGQVVQGQQLGRTIGFPTANLQIPPGKLVPQQGVYAVRVSGIAGHEMPVLGVMNIGNRPTVSGTHQSIEVHLLDWSGNLYDQTLTVELLEFIRSEQKFPSLDALKQQILTDCAIARARIASPS